MAQNAATLRLMSDLREMQKDAPEVAEIIWIWHANLQQGSI